MKWKAAVAVLVLCAVGACVWATQSKKPEPVFRDMCWGDPPEKLGPKRLLRIDKPPVAVYMKIGDPLRLNDLELESILYCFENDRLIGIEVIAKDYDALASAAAVKYAHAKYVKYEDKKAWYSGIKGTTTACVISKLNGKGRMLLMDMGMSFEDYMTKLRKTADSW